MGKKRKKPPMELICALCGKKVDKASHRYVSGITGRVVCDTCMGASRAILPIVETPEPAAAAGKDILTPQQIIAQLDKSIIGQAQAKRAVAVAMWKQQLRAAGDNSVPRTNLLLYGPTGCGKTALVREAARLAGLPFLNFDATTLTETGYRGRDAQEIVQDLQERFKKHPNVAHGVVLLDEIDKVSARGGETRTYANRGTQYALLKLVEGTEVGSFSTDSLLFIFAGSFAGLDAAKNGPQMRPIGFETQPSLSDNIPAEISVSDFVRFGMEPELMGRVGQYIPLQPLSAEDLERILLESDLSLYRQYQRFFSAHGIRLEFSPKRIRELVQNALDRGTGARGLNNLVEEAVEPVLLRLAEGIPFEEEKVLHAG